LGSKYRAFTVHIFTGIGILPQKNMATIWSFDLGKASIGEAVRDTVTNEFLHVASLLIPAEFASTKDARDRRRMFRTRQAHKAREAWLDEVWRAAGQEPLRKRTVWKNPEMKKWELKHPADERLEREFPAKGDKTCYTSCLLRIKLLRGEKLEPWQIYKALHSAIQRRGYDPEIPWKAKESRRRKHGEDDAEEAGTRARMEHFTSELKAMFPTREDCQLPCYFDAVKMGLCDSRQPDHLRERIDCHAESTRNQIVPRWLVEKEVRLLGEAAGKQVDGLKGKIDYLLWGPAGKAYASYDVHLRKQFGLREGGATDWQGVVGQKVPRFDNRIIDRCTLIPRLNVCKIKTDGKQPLPESCIIFEATFLMKLKNMRVQRTPVEQTGLRSEELKAIFEDPKVTGFKITVSQWRKLCAKFGVHPLPGYEEVIPPRAGGRSRFCRPALDILKRLILSGQPPRDFHLEELVRLNGNTDPKRGLVADDLKFLLQMGSTWDGIYIPNQKLDAILQRTEDADEAIREIIGSQNDPIVRHRLNTFYERLRILRAEHGAPETVALEFVREDFMGRKAVIEYRAFLKKRETERKRAREDAAKVGATERSAALKLELLREQGGICLYSGVGLHETKLDEYEIDHIVPRSKGGPDAVINYVLTTRAKNDEKDNRTPFEWLSKANAWDAYVQRVRGRGIALRNKKVKLLLNEDAVELAEKYTALAETAWISKLSRAILDAFFGWKNGNDVNGVKRVVIINGGLTSRIRRKYKLNSILNPAAVDEEEAEKKNRSDDRHHALDAMVINFIPGWTRDAAKEHFFRLPNGVHRETFARYVAEVMPRNLCLEKPVLAETIYGARKSRNGKVIVQRAEVLKLAYKPINISKSVYDLAYAVKQFKAIRDDHIRGLLEDFIRDEPPEEAWKDFCANFTLRARDGSPGSRVTHVLMNVGTADEYKDFSKDQAGAWRKAKKGHRGQVVYLDRGKPHVRPVYAFESEHAVRKELETVGAQPIGFFQSMCAVRLTEPVAHSKTPLFPGVFMLNTIRKDGFVVLTDKSGKVSQPISLAKLLPAGLRRID
jgi:CRISPR-associated endonuclease Csn1